MDFWQTVLVLVRRWYVTVPSFLATLGVAFAAYSSVPLQYQSASVLVLTTPLSGGTETTQPDVPNSLTNPLLNFDQSLALAASIVIQQMSSLETARALGVHPGGTTTYLVNNGSTNPELLESGPFLFIQGTASSPAAAEDITRRAAEMATRILAERQTELKAPTSTHIGMEVVVPATPGQPLTGSPQRMAAAAGGLAGLMSLCSVYGFESMATHRRRRRAESRRREHGSDQDGLVELPDPAPGPEPVGALSRSNGTEAALVSGFPRIPWRSGGPGPPREGVGRRTPVGSEQR